MSIVDKAIDFSSQKYLELLFGKCQSGNIIFCNQQGNKVLYAPHVFHLWEAAKFIQECREPLFMKFNPIDREATLRRSQYGTGNAEEVTEIVAFACDVDCGKGKYASREETLAKFSLLQHKPTLVVNTKGDQGGFHIYWVLDTPFAMGGVQSAISISKGLQAEVRALLPSLDGTADICRNLRPVGSVREDGTQVTVHEFNPDSFFSFEDLITHFPPKPVNEPVYRGSQPIESLLPSSKSQYELLKQECTNAEIGNRSEKDFLLLSHATKCCLDKDEVWCDVCDIGKFADKGQDYFDRTWRSAEKSNAVHWDTDPFKPQLHIKSFKSAIIDYAIGDIEPDAVLIDGLLRRRQVCEVISSSKAGKTVLMHSLAMHASAGENWLGFPIKDPLRVAIFDSELHMGDFGERFTALRHAHPYIDPDFDFFPCDDGFKVKTVQGIYDTLQKLKSHGREYDVIIVDSFYAFLPPDAREIDECAMKSVVNQLKDIAKVFNTGLIYTHHATKGDQSGKSIMDMGSGSGVLGRMVHSKLVLRQHERDDMAVMQWQNRSFKSNTEGVTIKFEWPTWTLVDVPPEVKTATNTREKKKRKERHTNERLLLSVLETQNANGGWFTLKSLCLATGKDHRTLRTMLLEMADYGVIEVDENYANPVSGKTTFAIRKLNLS